MTVFPKKDTQYFHFKAVVDGVTHQGSTRATTREEAELFEANFLESVRKDTQTAVASVTTIPATTPLSKVVSKLKVELRQKEYNTKKICRALDQFELFLGSDFPVENFDEDAIRSMIAREQLLALLQGRANHKKPFDVISALIHHGLHPHPDDPKLDTDELTAAKIEAEKYAKVHFKTRKPRAPGTIGLNIIGPAFMIADRAQKLGVILKNPPRREDYKQFQGKRGIGFLTREVEERLCNSCPAERADIYRFTISQMLRVSEVYNLKWQDVDLVTGTISIKTKNGKQHFKLFSKAKTILVNQLGKHEKYVFVHKLTNGKVVPFNSNLSSLFKQDVEAIDVEGLRFHDLRRTGAQRAFDIDTPINVIQYFLGHKEVRTTWRYINREPAPPTEAEMEKIELFDDIGRERVLDQNYPLISPQQQALGEWLAGELVSTPIGAVVRLARENPVAGEKIARLVSAAPVIEPVPSLVPEPEPTPVLEPAPAATGPAISLVGKVTNSVLSLFRRAGL